MITVVDLHNHPTASAVCIRHDQELAYLLDDDGNVLDVLDAEALDEVLTQEDEYE